MRFIINGGDMKVMIPLLSKKENDLEFLEQAVKGAKEVVMLVVVDNSLSESDFGFALKQMAQANSLLAEVKGIVGAKRKKAIDILEWGNTISKIANISKLREIDKVVLQMQEGKKFDELLAALEKEKVKYEVI